MSISVSVAKLPLNCIKTEISKNWNQFMLTQSLFWINC